MSKKLGTHVKIDILDTIQSIPINQWSALETSHFPFSDYDFLVSLERSNSLGRRTGWFPAYVTCWRNGRLEGALISFVKNNSYGEYIFDWDWAHGYSKHGLDYYPKITIGIPFTPATGPKVLLHPQAVPETRSNLCKSLHEFAQTSQCSSIHHLFLDHDEVNWWKRQGYLSRWSCQYHWQNQGYQSFEDFLESLKGKRAKEIRRERRQVKEQNLEIQTLTGDQINRAHAVSFFQLYLSTIEKKQSFDYLTQDFFELVFKSMKDRIVFSQALLGNKIVAGSLGFYKGSKLYGRYWGCLENFHCLHFELCYYRMIEFAIQKGLKTFEAGAQGPHKIKRGFDPTWTYSAHWIAQSGFAHAIERYIKKEKQGLDQFFHSEKMHSSYRS